MTIIKYKSKNLSEVLNSNFSPVFVKSFTAVRIIAKIAKYPIVSDCANNEVTNTKNIFIH